MRMRLLVLVALVLVWVPAWKLSRPETVKQLEFNNFASEYANPDTTEVLEGLYLRDSNFERLGEVEPRYQTSAPVHTNPARVRILVVGDSFTYGWGLDDLDARWGVQLEDILNNRTASGSFEVVVLAQWGASTITEAEWLQRLRAGQRPDPLATYQRAAATYGEFDALVLGFYSNDVVATDRYSSITEGKLTEIPRDMQNDVISGKIPNPQWPQFLSAAVGIKDAFAGKPVIWMPLTPPAPLLDEKSSIAEVFRDIGYVIAPNPRSAYLVSNNKPESLIVNPTDIHPGTKMLRAYALDAADAVLATLDEARVSEAVATAVPPVRPVVSNFLPIELQLSGTGNTITVVNPDTSKLLRPCVGYTSESVSYVCGVGGAATLVAFGESNPLRFAPCATLGRPYAQIMLDRHLSKGTKLAITLGKESAGPYKLFTIEYSEAGDQLFSEVGELHPGKPLALTVGAGSEVSGIALAETVRSSCKPVDGSPLTLKPFSASFTLGR